MKRKGSNFKYEDERNRNLHEAFKEQYIKNPPMTIERIASIISTRMPSKRFWITESRASIVISRMIRGDRLENMRPLRRKMFVEILRRVLEMKSRYPNKTTPELVKIVVRQPAPSFYLSEKTIKIILYRILNGWYEKRKKNQSY